MVLVESQQTRLRLAVPHHRYFVGKLLKVRQPLASHRVSKMIMDKQLQGNITAEIQQQQLQLNFLSRIQLSASVSFLWPIKSHCKSLRVEYAD